MTESINIILVPEKDSYNTDPEAIEFFVEADTIEIYVQGPFGRRELKFSTKDFKKLILLSDALNGERLK